MATFTFGIYTRADLETKLPLTLANLAVAFSAPARRTHEYKRITNLELPALYELRPGTSIRLRRLYELEKPAASPTASTVSRSCCPSATTTRRAGSSTS